MGETNISREPPAAETRDVVDALGRTLTLRALDPADILTLLEAAGTGSGNQAFMQYAAAICTCSAIQGVPLPLPTKRDHITANAKMLGTVGLAAVNAAMDAEAAAAPTPEEQVEVVKN